MSFAFQIGASCIFVILLIYVLTLVSRGKLLLKYSLLWIFLCCVALFCLLIPHFVYAISDFVGFITPSNFVLVMAVVLLLLICLSMSIAISRLVSATKNLTQRIALIEKAQENEFTSCKQVTSDREQL